MSTDLKQKKLDSYATKKCQINDTKEKDMETLKKIDQEMEALLKERDQTNERIKNAVLEENKLKKKI
jgi:hypothetical protein